MDRLTDCVERLERLRHPSDLCFARGGDAIIATVSPASHRAGESYQSRLWRFGLDGSAEALTNGPGSDGAPRPSPIDERLAFLSDRSLRGKRSVFLLEKDGARPVGEIPGTVEDLRWTSDGAALIALAADRGLDAGATEGAMRLSWGDIEDPAVTDPCQARRRLYRIDAAGGATAEIGPADLTVWEFDLLGDDAALALVSADPSERGWYRARLARLDLARRTAEILHESSWQLQGPAADPEGRRVAFLEGWSSDRGLVAGAIRILDLASGLRHQPGRRQALQCHGHTVARCGKPLVRRLASPGLCLWRHRPRRHYSMDRAGGCGHRPQQLPRPDHARAGRQELRRRSRGRRPSARDRAETRRRQGLASSLQAERHPDAGLRWLSRGAGDLLARRRRARYGGLRPAAAGSQAGAPAHDLRHPWRADLGRQAWLQSRLRFALCRRGLCRLPAELSRQCRLGPGFFPAQYRRSRRGRVRGHIGRCRSLHRPGLRRCGPHRRDRRQLWRLSDRLGRGHDQPLPRGHHGLRHRQ